MNKIFLLCLLIINICSCAILKESKSYNKYLEEVENLNEFVFYSKEKISYGEHDRQYYLLFKPEVITKNEVIFFTHGGGWKQGSPEELEYIADFFVKLGYQVVMPSYRLTPDYRYPDIVDDIFTAFSEADMYLTIGDEYIDYLVMGVSAGANLSALLVLDTDLQEKHGIDRNKFSAFFSFAGVLDMDQCKNMIIRSMIKQYVAENDEHYFSANPVNHIDINQSLEIFILHSEDDGIAEIENVQSFYDSAVSDGYSAKIHIQKNLTHDRSYSSLFLNSSNELKILIEWLDSI